VLDTSAWGAFFSGSPAGARVQDLLSAGDAATCVISLAELSDLYQRGPEPDALDEDLAFVATATDVVPVLAEVARIAGRTKVEHRRRAPRFGLIDALILETARHHEAVLVTTDEDFRGLTGVEILRR
jgi:predicted nucleic acid-binding protein